jgi:hypothetical protein
MHSRAESSDFLTTRIGAAHVHNHEHIKKLKISKNISSPPLKPGTLKMLNKEKTVYPALDKDIKTNDLKC